jgi:hypothetical protein
LTSHAFNVPEKTLVFPAHWGLFLRPCCIKFKKNVFNFPEKTLVFPAHWGLFPAKKSGQFSAQREALPWSKFKKNVFDLPIYF